MKNLYKKIKFNKKNLALLIILFLPAVAYITKFTIFISVYYLAVTILIINNIRND
jgi:hypothetical protein